MKKILFLYISIAFSGFAQQSKIKIVHADQTYSDQQKHPDALILNGSVKVKHQGAVMTCKKALYFQTTNILHAYGDVYVNQGDTLTQNSKYMRYNGNTKKAVSWGKVVVKEPEMTLTTDTLYFDREKQELYYNDFGTIKDVTNTLTSINGRYYSQLKKFKATNNVKLVNPDQTLTTDQLDYYTESGKAYIYGPSNVVSNESDLYTERGIFETKKSLGYLLKNSLIKYDNRTVAGDSLYYNNELSIATGTGNLVITDTVNNIIVKGDYGEVYKDKDSVIINKKPLAISIMDKDSMYIHGDTLLITGDQENRLLRTYHHVKIFKTDLRGKCDSLVSFQTSGITELFTNPVLWTQGNQITGDSIRLTTNKEKTALDSLKVLRRAFIVQKDTIDTTEKGAFNQIKGKNMFGKFENQKLSSLLCKGNGGVINYARDEDQELNAIMKMECSNILFSFKEGKINTIRFLKKPDGKTYPPSKFPKDQARLQGYIWRESEMPITKEDIFIHDAYVEVDPYAKNEDEELE